MNNSGWTHVLGNTWCLELHVTIPVFFLNSREVILLDTGYGDLDREALLTLLDQRNVHVRAVLGSHSHNDHSGSHAYFQERHGAEVILQETEAAIVSDFSLMTTAYAPATAEELKREVPHLLLRADRTFSAEARSLEIDGAVFGLIPLPGHTPGHTGIVTPDGVLYVGDTVVDDDTLRAAKLPSTWDWGMDLQSKRYLREMRHPAYILAHRGVRTEIADLVDRNIDDKLRRAEQISTWLRERGPVTQNEAEQLLWDKLGLHSCRFFSQVVFWRNVRCALDYLVRIGTIHQEFRNGTVLFVPIKTNGDG